MWISSLSPTRSLRRIIEAGKSGNLQQVLDWVGKYGETYDHVDVAASFVALKNYKLDPTLGSSKKRNLEVRLSSNKVIRLLLTKASRPEVIDALAQPIALNLHVLI